MSIRARARELAKESLSQGDPTGWFEKLYHEASEGRTTVPWADLAPNPNLLDFWYRQTALKIGCGLGDDAEQLAAWGFQTTAFDISPTAIQECKRRFPDSKVTYVVGDLLNPPAGQYDFVLESYTVQVLPQELRERAIANVAGFVRPGGSLLVIARGREESEPQGEMPWPLTRRQMDEYLKHSLELISFEDFMDRESPPVRRFRALYRRPLRP